MVLCRFILQSYHNLLLSAKKIAIYVIFSNFCLPGPARMCVSASASEEIGGSYRPIAVFAIDFLAVVSYADSFQCVGESEAVACSHLYVAQQLKSEAEVPSNSHRLVLVGICDGFLACEECEAGTCGYEWLYNLIDDRD